MMIGIPGPQLGGLAGAGPLAEGPIAATMITWVLVVTIAFVVAAAVIKIRQLRRWRAAQVALEAMLAHQRDESALAAAVEAHTDAPLSRICGALLGVVVSDRSVALLDRAVIAERRRLMTFMVALGTVAAIAPFIGLLGTVYGILDAFMRIGEHGSATLAIVAPAVGEALGATALGLVAAIPAVVAYNMIGRALEDMLQDARATALVVSMRVLGLRERG